MIAAATTAWLIDPVPATIMTLCLAALWLAAGLHKLTDLTMFERSVAAYDIVPRALIPLFGRLLPVLELALGVSLLIARTRLAAAVLGALLLAGYGAAIAANLHRGRHDLDCGCLGFGAQSQISSTLVWRNGVAAVASLSVGLLPRAQRVSNWMDTWTIIAGAVVIALLYLAMEGLRLPAQRVSRRG